MYCLPAPVSRKDSSSWRGDLLLERWLMVTCWIWFFLTGEVVIILRVGVIITSWPPVCNNLRWWHRGSARTVTVLPEVTDEHRNSNVSFGLCEARSDWCVAQRRVSGMFRTVTNVGGWFSEESGFDTWQGQEVLISLRRFILFWCPSSLLSSRNRGILSVGIKQMGRETNKSPPSNVKLKNAWSHTSLLTNNFSFKCVNP
jgi:hypothetical protein